MLSRFSHVQLFATLWTVACQAPLSVGFSRQEHWSGLPCPPPGDLPMPGMEPASLVSPAWAGGSFTTSTTWDACASGVFFVILIQGTVPFNRWTVPITGFLPFSSIPVNQWSCSVCVRLFATPWAVAYQAPAFMELSRQEYRRGLLFPFSRGSSRPRDRT